MTPIPQFSHTVVKSYFYLKPWSAWLHSIPTAAPDLLFLPIYASSSLPWASRPSGRAAPAAWAGRRRSGVAHRRGGPAARRAGADGVGGGAAGLVGTGAGGQRQGAPAWALEQRGRPAAGRAGADGGAARKAGSGARRSGRRSCAGGRRGARRHGGREWRREEVGVGRGAGIGAGCEAEDCARPGERTKTLVLSVVSNTLKILWFTTGFA